MLTPLFSQHCDLVGWIQPRQFLFDVDMTYVAFLANGHAWSARSGLWIGPVVGTHVFDTEGRPVAWNPGEPLRGFGKPLRPVNVVRAVSPVRPTRPITPPRPLTAPVLSGGWSPLTFAEWLVANDPVQSVLAGECALVIRGDSHSCRSRRPRRRHELGTRRKSTQADPDEVK